ncbi:hypothetical protein RM780_07830 [Streptomyces sp. DSM 44917]|uniref:Uncharacterized protein n=1 Tax=Streptomyces boetiae TaxID=3075541 RepID=A0ABU2L5N3_9ACTN|nr:hypothetical protein [Streptomyces sp. DSM 44917]MDT0306872.1 hypothetical protein [Streptomyces sp. DSM 44917]
MSAELRDVRVSFTVRTSEHLPRRDGERMYADDVEEEVRGVVASALRSWYDARGRDLLVCDPGVS